MRLRILLSLAIVLLYNAAVAQGRVLAGKVTGKDGQAIESATIAIPQLNAGGNTDETGNYVVTGLPKGEIQVIFSAVGYESSKSKIELNKDTVVYNVTLIQRKDAHLDEVVVSGTLKEMSKLDSPVPVEVYTKKFFQANPTPSIFDALQNVNGVRPQLNCNICNTGDIHINGLEGPYTMILIDGMPIVSGLSTVYGLSGIPQALIERVEVVKGPASTLYGSEAVGGLVNIITKSPANTPILSADVFATSWGEVNTDVAGKLNLGKLQSLLGVNYYNYQNPQDNNNDGFTDVTLQNRISIFNKWSMTRKDLRTFSIAGRYVYEDRWGGDMRWSKEFRGGDCLYAESIYTRRWEFFGNYQLPVKEKLTFSFSANGHDQNSVYGNMPFLAKQYIGFGQLTWNKQVKWNDLVIGAAFRYTYYDDNTPATSQFDTAGTPANMPSNTYLPGIFIQDEITINKNNKLLAGLRYDHNSLHGNIFTPRINYKWNSDDKSNVLRLSIGNGYRVANIFTEDHAALTGSRQVVFLENLNPETSWNGNINYVKKIYATSGVVTSFDATLFYTRFQNKIIADYDTDPNKIIYDNLKGYAISQGASLNIDLSLPNGFKFIVGGTFMDVYSMENNKRIQQLFTEKFTGVWNISYTIRKRDITFDYTGNVYSPMRLPLLSAMDPRNEYSPWWSIQNIQLTKKFKKGIEIYGGIKNLLNWTPNRGNPFIIARSNDPFDKNVQFDANGKVIATTENPYALTFDPSYVYGPNQGRRLFLGLRWMLK